MKKNTITSRFPSEGFDVLGLEKEIIERSKKMASNLQAYFN